MTTEGIYDRGQIDGKPRGLAVHSHFPNTEAESSPTAKAVERAMWCAGVICLDGRYYDLGVVIDFLDAPDHDVVNNHGAHQAEDYALSWEYTAQEAAIHVATHFYVQTHDASWTQVVRSDPHMSADLEQEVLKYIRGEIDTKPQISFLE